MSLLHLLSYGGAVAAFIFVTLSLASGLLWLSELIEEHSRSAKLVGQRGIYAIILLHILLYFFDNLPIHLVAFSIVCHVVYLQNFTPSWPIVSLTSPGFLASCALVIMDHFAWFFHFARITQDARHRARNPYGQRPQVPGFADIATFFGLCVWLAPLFLFLSLSAGDNTLPTNLNMPASAPSSPTKAAHVPPQISTRRSLFKTLYDVLPIDSLPRLRPKPRRDSSQGLIAPPSPNRITSPLPSPALRRASSSQSLTPMTPPPRRVSSDSGMLTTDSFESFNTPDQFSSFTLTPPPKKSIAPSPIRRSTTSKMEMRRAVSSSAYDPDH